MSDVKVLYHSDGDYVPKEAFDKAVKALKEHAVHWHKCLWHVRHRDDDCQCGLSQTLKDLGCENE